MMSIFNYLLKININLKKGIKMLDNFRYRNKMALFNKIYSTIDGFGTSKKTRQNLNLLSDKSLVYGEVDFMSFKEIIDLANPKKNDVFFDLGSGSGKAVIIAAMCFDFSACIGIELLEPLHQLSAEALKVFHENSNGDIKNIPEIKFYHQNLIHTDLSSADLIFINATCFPVDFWNTLIKAFDQLEKGVKIIINTKKIDSHFFKEIYSGSHLMSWGMNSVRIYEKINK